MNIDEYIVHVVAILKEGDPEHLRLAARAIYYCSASSIVCGRLFDDLVDERANEETHKRASELDSFSD